MTTTQMALGDKTLGSTPACKETRGVVSLPYLDFLQGFLTAKGKEKRPKIGVPWNSQINGRIL
jgi:hypothetical protein